MILEEFSVFGDSLPALPLVPYKPDFGKFEFKPLTVDRPNSHQWKYDNIFPND
jgi:hypothetical protein